MVLATPPPGPGLQIIAGSLKVLYINSDVIFSE